MVSPEFRYRLTVELTQSTCRGQLCQGAIRDTVGATSERAAREGRSGACGPHVASPVLVRPAFVTVSYLIWPFGRAVRWLVPSIAARVRARPTPTADASRQRARPKGRLHVHGWGGSRYRGRVSTPRRASWAKRHGGAPTGRSCDDATRHAEPTHTPRAHHPPRLLRQVLAHGGAAPATGGTVPRSVYKISLRAAHHLAPSTCVMVIRKCSICSRM